MSAPVIGGEHVVYPCTCGAAPGIHLHKRTRHFIAPTPRTSR